MKRVMTQVAIHLAILLSIAVNANAQSSHQANVNARLDDAVRALLGARDFQQADISPDGKRVAWVESIPQVGDTPSSNLAIYVVDSRARAAPTRVTAGDGKSAHDEHSLAWSPDSQRLAFLSDAARLGQLQLYVVNADGGRTTQVTHLSGLPSRASWSPDGKTIAILFDEHAGASAAPLDAKAPEMVSDEISQQRLALVDSVSGDLRQISPAGMFVYEFDWAPGSNRVVVTAAHGSGSNNWWIAGLFIVDAASGEMRPLLEKPQMQVAMPRWAPDDSRIAFIGGLMSDAPIIGGDIYAIPVAGGAPTNLTPGTRITATSISWASDSRSLIFGGISDGQTTIASLAQDGKISSLWTGAERVARGRYNPQISLARDGKTSAAIRQSFSEPPELWAGPIGEWKQITHRNAGLRPAWGKAVNLHWTTDIGPVQGWLIYPRDFDPAKKYPMVVVVHGGPAAAQLPSWPGRTAFQFALPSAGYFLLFPNPRGSYGGGEKFAAGNVKDFGYGDFRDILAGVDEAIKQAPVDPNRLGITGWSYGGYMSMWAVTQTKRFRAAVAGAGLANWQSYYGENKIDQWMPPYFGATVYDDPAVYARSSPITFIKNAKTPTLIIVGDRDISCPAPQSYEFWHALKTIGVPTELAVYPGEGHFFVDPAHNRDVVERTVAWFDQYLQASH
jgi:dipeptidyl aminopeptidase/acylaminoacyl peptidase